VGGIDHKNGKSNLFALNRESLSVRRGHLNLTYALCNAMIVSQVPDQTLERLQ
jgi:hypothetical protein